MPLQKLLVLPILPASSEGSVPKTAVSNANILLRFSACVISIGGRLILAIATLLSLCRKQTLTSLFDQGHISRGEYVPQQKV